MEALQLEPFEEELPMRRVRTFPGAGRSAEDNDSPTSAASTSASFDEFDKRNAGRMSWPTRKLQNASSCSSLQSRRGYKVALPHRREEATYCDCFTSHGYSVGCVIGRSQHNRGFSVVSVTKGDGAFAAKVTDEGAGEGILRDTLRKEYEILSLLDHSGIVRAVALIEATVGCGMVMERCRGVLLESLLPAGGALCRLGRHAVLERILDAVAYLHGQQVAHRDLHAENVMVDVPAAREANGPAAAPRVKVIDFGSARGVADEGGDQERRFDSDISPGIKPPECAWDMPRPLACDVFQVGLLAAGLFAGRSQATRHVVKGGALVLPEGGLLTPSAAGRAHMAALLDPLPERRPEARASLASLPPSRDWAAKD